MARMESWTGRPAPRNWSDHQKLWRRVFGKTNVTGHNTPLFLPVTVAASEPEEQPRGTSNDDLERSECVVAPTLER